MTLEEQQLEAGIAALEAQRGLRSSRAEYGCTQLSAVWQP
jgi:hypothetical protein